MANSLNKPTIVYRNLFLFVLVLSAMSFEADAQKQGQDLIDSLITELGEAKEDTHRIFLMSNISFSYSSIDPDEGLKYGNDAVALSKKLDWGKGAGKALYYRGANYLNKSMFPEALNDYLEAEKYFEKIGDRSKLAGTYSNIGSVYGYQGKSEKALEYFTKALAINQQINPNSNFIVANLGNIGIIYLNEKEFAKAEEFMLKAIALCQKIGNKDMLPNSLVTLGGIYLELKETLKALVYIKQAIPAAKEIGDVGTSAISDLNLGKAILQMVALNRRHLLDSLYQGNRQAALDEARGHLAEAIRSLEEIGDQVSLANAYDGMVDLEEYQGNYKSALAYHKLFKTVRDSVFNEDKNEKILQSAMQYEFDKKEAVTRLEQAQKDIRNKNIAMSISAALASALIFLFVLYRQRNKIKQGKKRSDELLLNILPAEVAEELKAKGRTEAKHFDETTVMFTDFKGFTQISEKVSPAELVAEIDFCFKAFDEIITRNNLEKIKTIGDSYMCAGGLPTPNSTHASDIVNAGLEIQQFMHQHWLNRQKEGKEAFEIRIGINTGPVVAGIVGLKKFAYDIWGDSVNIASRMESSCETGKINISGSTHALVKDKFACSYRGKIAVKYKGEIDMYFVDAKSTG